MEEIEQLLHTIVMQTTETMQVYKTDSGMPLHASFREKMTNFGGRAVIVHDDSTGRDIVGTIEGIDEMGRLLLRDQTTREIAPPILAGTLRIAQ
ncbi:MAG: hypothetical protein LBG04_00625 [Holosporaceae bacterium]|jgi:biotin-(acetyl-CoA carboxylase) ligase|nr:hypothetical protein [Holosporaceae bacterium]